MTRFLTTNGLKSRQDMRHPLSTNGKPNVATFIMEVGHKVPFVMGRLKSSSVAVDSERLTLPTNTTEFDKNLNAVIPWLFKHYIVV